MDVSRKHATDQDTVTADDKDPDVVNRWKERYVADHPQAVSLRKAIHSATAQGGVGLEHVAIAVSGGPDSALMAVQLALLAREMGQRPHMFHIHHGLQAPADEWRDHVHDLAHLLGLPCHSQSVQVASDTGQGTEGAARQARYQALTAMAREQGVQAILLAHHRDDQAETVLLRLLRGSGPAGLSAMAPQTQRDGLLYLRPWLDVDRARILQQMQLFSMASDWWPVYDPTNHQDRYTRSAVRERLTPELNQRWPGWQAILARHARLAAQSSQVLDEVGAADFATLQPSPDGRRFSLQSWRQLTPARQALVIRHWLARHGYRPPTEARLNDLLRQLREVHALAHDRHIRVQHVDTWIGCHRGEVYLEAHPFPGAGATDTDAQDKK